MPGADEGAVRELLLRLLRQPTDAFRLSLGDWDIAVRQARQAGVLARLCFQLDALGCLKDLPERPRIHLEAARTLALKHARDVRWEVACVRRLLAKTGVPMILLKGAAYLMADLPPSRGRLFADIDFMVPRERIAEVEETLTGAEWVSGTTDPYDQQYYRRWTHQIPPLQHDKRNTVLDVHHTIVPLTARSTVDADTLSIASQALGEDPGLRVLASADMVLHSAVHLFNEGEFEHGLRDLLDVDDLLRHFGAEEHFWETLASRAEAIRLTGPLYLALRYREHFLHRCPPEALRRRFASWGPAPPKRASFDFLFHRALLPDHRSCDRPLTGLARWLLYVRAHYLRMPLHLLLPHLLRKAVFRPGKA